MKILKKLQIQFWKIYAIVWDLRPRMHLPNFSDYPIARTDISDIEDAYLIKNGKKVKLPKYEYPSGVKVLFEWDEKGHHWIVFSRR